MRVDARSRHHDPALTITRTIDSPCTARHAGEPCGVRDLHRGESALTDSICRCAAIETYGDRWRIVPPALDGRAMGSHSSTRHLISFSSALCGWFVRESIPHSLKSWSLYPPCQVRREQEVP